MEDDDMAESGSTVGGDGSTTWLGFLASLESVDWRKFFAGLTFAERCRLLVLAVPGIPLLWLMKFLRRYVATIMELSKGDERQ